ncbi:hypothetical protein HPB52_011362 [Rhipicephalus sanguineus]|uniref:Uncharacterized protein n=1 Tax=Rhipicephalus sanguineus TaxID=34632 RepID=A0A9D4PZH2_RHISA|nr:hypothetical protein HPB52_011362 [Rhipicephalus sanguineus]
MQAAPTHGPPYRLERVARTPAALRRLQHRGPFDVDRPATSGPRSGHRLDPHPGGPAGNRLPLCPFLGRSHVPTNCWHKQRPNLRLRRRIAHLDRTIEQHTTMLARQEREQLCSGLCGQLGCKQTWHLLRHLLDWQLAQDFYLSLLTDPKQPTRIGNSVCRDTTPDLSFCLSVRDAH